MATMFSNLDFFFLDIIPHGTTINFDAYVAKFSVGCVAFDDVGQSRMFCCLHDTRGHISVIKSPARSGNLDLQH